MPSIQIPPLRKEASNPPLHPPVSQNNLPGRRIKPLALPQRILLNQIPKRKNRRKRVCKLHETYCSSHICQAEEIRNGSCEHECYGPVDWDDDCPEEFAALSLERWGVEEFHEDVVVEDFDSDVAV